MGVAGGRVRAAMQRALTRCKHQLAVVYDREARAVPSLSLGQLQQLGDTGQAPVVDLWLRLLTVSVWPHRRRQSRPPGPVPG